MNRLKVLMTVGDPGGVGPEILWSILQPGELQEMAEITVLGPARTVTAIPQGVHWEDVDLPTLRFHKRPHPDNGRISLLALEEACRRMARQEADLLVTGPLSKEAIRRCGIPFSGHTEYLGNTFKAKPYMVFFTGSTPVALFTMHVPLQEVSSILTRESLESYIRGLATAWQRQLNVRPRFRVAGR